MTRHKNHGTTATTDTTPRAATITAVIASKGRTATTPCHSHDGHARRPCTTTARTPRHDHHGHRRPRRTRHGHDHGHRHDTAMICTATPHAITHTKDRARLIAHDTQSVNRTNIPPLQHTTNPRWGSLPPGQKTGAAGSLVLTLNARWNIFGLPVTHEVFTYLVVATVVAPYILCIMFLGLMLMAVKLA